MKLQNSLASTAENLISGTLAAPSALPLPCCHHPARAPAVLGEPLLCPSTAGHGKVTKELPPQHPTDHTQQCCIFHLPSLDLQYEPCVQECIPEPF